MKRTFALFLLAVALSGNFAAEGLAAGRRAQAQQNAAQPQTAPHAAHNAPAWVLPNGATYRYNPYYHYRAMYPKYYYGSHARTQEFIGIPNGDIGIRGNGITPNPW